MAAAVCWPKVCSGIRHQCQGKLQQSCRPSLALPGKVCLQILLVLNVAISNKRSCLKSQFALICGLADPKTWKCRGPLTGLYLGFTQSLKHHIESCKLLRLLPAWRSSSAGSVYHTTALHWSALSPPLQLLPCCTGRCH